MAWPSVNAGDPLLASQFNSLSAAIAAWQGNVTAGGFTLTNLGGLAFTGTPAVTFPGIVTFTVAPVFTAQAASRTALGLGTAATATAGNFTEATSAVLTITGGTGGTLGNVSVQVKQASSTVSGYLSSTDWGTFNSKQAALTLGNLTEATSAVLTITGGTGAIIGTGLSIQVKQSSGSVSGYLSSTDWTTFNNKQGALTLPLAIGQGGTGQTTAAAGFNALSPLTTLGDLVYASAANTSSRLAGNTTAAKQFLVQTGTGTVSAAPAWAAIAAADVPTLNQNTTGTAANVTGVVALLNGGTGQTTAAAALTALGGASLTANNSFTASGYPISSVRPSNFASNSIFWGFSIQNSGATDNLALGQSGTTYTTGGVLGWLGNSMAYVYYPSEFRIGTGVGATPVLTFKSTGNVVIGSLTDGGQQFQVAGTSAFTGTTTFTVAPVFTAQAATRTALGLTSTATATAANLTEVTSAVLTITGGTGAVLGSGTTLQVKQATSVQSGYLSSTDWATFNSKQNAVAVFVASGASHAIGLVPDPGVTAGTTRFLREDATWTAPPATAWGSITGTLSSQTDLSTALAAKQATLTIGNLTEATSAVLTITGGSAAVIGSGASIQVKQASSTVSGYLLSTDWATFNAKQAALTLGNLTEATSSVLTITGGTGAIIGTGLSLQVKQASTTQGGYLSNTDWNTFNSKQNAVAVFVASGASHAIGLVPDPGVTAGTTRFLREDATWVAPAATAWGSITGTLASQSDLSTALSGKQATLTIGSFTEATSAVLTITGGTGAVIGSGLSVAVKQATTSQSGYLSSADWNTFNGKQGALTLPLGIGQGGTGQTTAAAAYNVLTPMTTLGDLVYASAANTAARLAGNTTAAKQFLVQTGTGTVSAAPTWAAIAVGDVPTLNQSTTGNAATATTSTNIAGGLLGSVPYQSAVGATALLAGNTVNAKRFLVQTGTGTVSAAPAWTAIVAADLPTGNLTEATSAVLTITGGSGAVIGTGLSIQVKQATSTVSGYLLSTDWATFNAKQAALTFGNLTEATSAVLTITGGTGAVIGSGLTIQVKQATSAQSGFLSSTDWATFNSKQNAVAVFVASGASHAIGLVPDPGATAGTTRFLREDASWAAPTAAAAWGSITGTLSAQTDLNTALAGKQATLTIGNFTEATSAVLTITGGTGSVIGSGLSVTVKQAATGQSGYLSNTDWNTFNGKQAALTLPLSIGQGGTGQTTATAAFNALSPLTTLGDLLYASAANTTARLAGNTTAAKQFLVQTGTGTVSAAPIWAAIAVGDVPTLNQSTSGNAATATSATNVAGGSVGAVHYQSAVGATAFLTGNTAAQDQVLVSHGTGAAAQAPTLVFAPAISAANMSAFPTFNQNTTGTSANVTGTVAIGNGGTGQTTAAAALTALGGVNSTQAAAAAPVQSVFGRTGAVAAVSTDYGTVGITLGSGGMNLNGQTVSGNATFSGNPTFSGTVAAPFSFGTNFKIVSSTAIAVGTTQQTYASLRYSATNDLLVSAGSGGSTYINWDGGAGINFGNGLQQPSGASITTAGVGIFSSVSITTPANIVFGTGWTAWTITGLAGLAGMPATLGTVTDAKYLRVGPTCFIRVQFNVTVSAPLSRGINLTVPFTNSSTAFVPVFALISQDNGGTLKPANAYMNPSSAVMTVNSSDFTAFTGTAIVVYLNGVFPC